MSGEFSTFFESKRDDQTSWLAAKEFLGEADISKVRIEDGNLILEIAGSADYQHVFDYLTTVGSFKENQTQVSKHTAKQLSVPLSKKAITMLSACSYLSDEVYFKLLHIVAAIKVAKETVECDYSPSDDEKEVSLIVNKAL